MLSLTEPIWRELEGGDRLPYDASKALARMESGESVRDEFWNKLHHQGDVGVASYAAIPQLVWFTSTESFAKVLSAGNRELLQVIAKEAPSSLDELARITGRAKSNLSRTLKTMEGYGLVRLERGDKGRITPKVTHDRVELDLPLIGSHDTDQSRKVD
jgi:predicted transcriptional regulator